MSLWIEFYEVPTRDGYEYYFMPLDADAKNKENIDNKCTRIWKLHKKSFRTITVLDRRKDNPPVMSGDELFALMFIGKPVPYDEYYLRLQEVKQRREQREAEKSTTVDQIQDT